MAASTTAAANSSRDESERRRLRLVRKRGKVLIAAAAGVGVVALGGLAYIQLMKKGYIKYNEYGRRLGRRRRGGDLAPDLELAMYDGSPVRLSSPAPGRARGRRPAGAPHAAVVLVVLDVALLHE